MVALFHFDHLVLAGHVTLRRVNEGQDTMKRARAGVVVVVVVVVVCVCVRARARARVRA